MPIIEPARQENGSLTGVKAAGEGVEPVTGEGPSPVGMATGAFGEGAVNSAFGQPEEPTFEELWSQIKPKTSFDTNESGGETSVSSSRGDSPSAGGGKGNSSLVDFAKRFLGTPYKWGGTSPSGFDCSGFTQYVFKQFGINLPRISYQQGNGGKAVAKGDLRPGDLVFWDNSSRNVGADHLGIYIGGGKYIHSPQPGSAVKISNLGGGYWARRYTSGSSGGPGGPTRQRAV